jgi:hypothetical protein
MRFLFCRFTKYIVGRYPRMWVSDSPPNIDGSCNISYICKAKKGDGSVWKLNTEITNPHRKSQLF